MFLDKYVIETPVKTSTFKVVNNKSRSLKYNLSIPTTNLIQVTVQVCKQNVSENDRKENRWNNNHPYTI